MCCSLLWSGIEDAVAKGSETDGGVVMRLGAVVQMYLEQSDIVPTGAEIVVTRRRIDAAKRKKTPILRDKTVSCYCRLE